MKITGVNRSDPASIRKADRAKGASSPFALATPTADAPAPASAPAPLAAVDALIALQEQSDALEGRRRAVRRGRDMLDLLDDVRHGLLTGAIPEAKLSHLLSTVQSARGGGAEPALDDILADIELRARVELAKLGRFT
jgi:hypothetical protein